MRNWITIMEDVSDDTVMGGYVNKAPYLEMRLRMRLTGTNAPTPEQWVEALSKLLDDLGNPS
jgi:hypothetical protein